MYVLACEVSSIIRGYIWRAHVHCLGQQVSHFDKVFIHRDCVLFNSLQRD